jgi:phospholipid/cholesterol/gamma-HCH transport system substrate-binding protein
MNRNAVETVMGAVVLVVAAVFLFFAYTTSQVRPVASGYEITAVFSRIDGLRDGSDVRIAGIRVGSVVSQKLDPQSFAAVVTMNIEDSIKLPTDSAATIASAGLLGDNFLSIIPGADDEIIKKGGKITNTTPPTNIMSLVSAYLNSGASTSSKSGNGDHGK